MFAIGGVEVLLFSLILVGIGVWVVYWMIRFAVRHGTLDAMRQDRLEQERRHERRPRTPADEPGL